MTTKPTPQTWTLLLKQSRSTILLHADKNAPLSTLKTQLLLALTDTCPSGTFNAHPIPTSPSLIQFAKYTEHATWESLEEVTDADDVGSKKKSSVTAASAGLRDGSVVGFRFVSEDGGDVLDGEGEWDVVLPTYDDIYGLGEEPEEEAEGEGEMT